MPAIGEQIIDMLGLQLAEQTVGVAVAGEAVAILFDEGFERAILRPSRGTAAGQGFRLSQPIEIDGALAIEKALEISQAVFPQDRAIAGRTIGRWLNSMTPSRSGSLPKPMAQIPSRSWEIS